MESAGKAKLIGSIILVTKLIAGLNLKNIITSEEEELRMDSRLPTGLKRPEILSFKPFATVKIGGRLTIADILGGLESSNKCRSSPGGRREWSITHIPREENRYVANLGSSTEIKGSDCGTFIQLMHSVLDVDGYYEVNTTNLVWDWRNTFIEYLQHGKLPEDQKASRALRTKAARYILLGGQLYRRSFQGPLARCLGASEANYVMREVHEGICGNYSSADSLVLKMVRAGYYWPRMEQDAKAFVQKCDKCQRHAQFVYQPAELLHSVLSPWPFKKWSLQKIGERKVVDFLWKNIICWFGIPKYISCDNGPLFIGSKVTKILEDLKIKRITSSPYHSSLNGQADSTNKVIIQNLKKRLVAAKGKWPEELPGVLWAYRTTIKSSMEEAPFSIVYGAEALIPVEVGEPTLRYFRMEEDANNEAWLVKLELLDEHRDLAHIRMMA
ncbi:uncharacterized protein LOC142177121 [Nicotiana tabacum]|uniref:Uncharacterized protein LOC142177121 n=1 Tax=Nicotiana tabacum TaxID=4097 RepID=A0AC58TWU2_TOBAC